MLVKYKYQQMEIVMNLRLPLKTMLVKYKLIQVQSQKLH